MQGMEINHKLAVGLGIAALALPTGAVAKPHDPNGNGQTKTVQYIVKGAYAGSGVVSVEKANGHAKKAGWKGEDVAFDFSSAQIDVEDTNLDGVANLEDVVVGVSVKVKARLPKRDPGPAPYVAQRLVDKS
jgi:hypothetical protein